jgi:DNA modification methylase
MINKENLHNFFENFKLPDTENKTIIKHLEFEKHNIPVFINEYWTKKQRQSNRLHEISYRACFKAELPRFFITNFSEEGDTIFDPFSGRGTTLIESALLNRNIIGNDVNPLSEILTLPRINIPNLEEIEFRLHAIFMETDYDAKADIDLSMFYDEKTLAELVSLRDYLIERKQKGTEGWIDKWIRMVATNRLTGHSNGFFSVYSLPPNQAASQRRQKIINEKRNQSPTYKDVKSIIFKKSKSLLSQINNEIRSNLHSVAEKASFYNHDAADLNSIPDKSIKLTITSPPFLNVVQYAEDNWLRCWFNDLDSEDIAQKITATSSLKKWRDKMSGTLNELFRITKHGGWIAFEVGEVQKKSVNLDEEIVKLAIEVGFDCPGIMINQQDFTKTSNIWGVSNNSKGTNTNRIVLLTC